MHNAIVLPHWPKATFTIEPHASQPITSQHPLKHDREKVYPQRHYVMTHTNTHMHAATTTTTQKKKKLSPLLKLVIMERGE